MIKRTSTLSILLLLTSHNMAQNVGIGTTNPRARLHIVDSTVIFSAAGDIPLDAGNTPIIGNGRRMMWYSDKSAFRAGYVPSSEWDKVNIGNYSAALGYGTTASNVGTTALGFQTTASGVFSTATGFQTVAKAIGSFVAGNNNDITDGPDPNNPLPLDRIFQIGNGNFSNTRSNALTVLRNGNVGIGTVSPSTRLQIAGPSRIDGPASAGGYALSIGGFGDLQVDGVGAPGGRFVVKENGNVGIGNGSPGYPLNFASVLGDKISLWGTSGGHYGFGIQSNLLQLYSDGVTSDIAFGYGSSSSFTEKLRIKGNGALAVNGSTGTPGQVLQSNGNSSPPSWKTLGALIQTYYHYPPGLFQFEGTLTSGITVVFSALTFTITVSTKSRLIITGEFQASNGGCVNCGGRACEVDVRINGNEVIPGDHGILDVSVPNLSTVCATISNFFYDVNPGTYTIEFIAQNSQIGDLYCSSKYSTLIVLPID